MATSVYHHPAQFIARRPAQTTLAHPVPSLLAGYLKARLASEREDRPLAASSRLAGVVVPPLPRIGLKALWLYANRRAVQSYPLIFTTLALAHPN